MPVAQRIHAADLQKDKFIFRLPDFWKVATSLQVQRDENSVKVLEIIDKTITYEAMAFGRFASIDMSVTVGLVGRLDLDKQLWLKPRLPKDLHFLFGGWTTSASNNLLKYNCRAAKWRVMVNRHTTARACHGMAVVSQRVYIVGGFNSRMYLHRVDCFDVARARCSAKANMACERCNVCVFALQASTIDETHAH
ncbi:hypothetical protein HPB49_000072 [Dermacentor silvarum]|uniref:Uncharacterized protein n=1 Tax=Dermacentor silvarum TaxID=543639 RepID=A0ACB8DRY3_DERSI|nr:hypothetical protein HPB49_000072 [Dermacentor silvarum]